MQKTLNRQTLAAAAVATCILLAILYLLGQPWVCKTGIGLWSASRARCTSQHFLDPYTLTHVLHGILFFWLLQPLASKIALHRRVLTAYGLELVWELVENLPYTIERYRQTAAIEYRGDSLLNVLGDLLATVVGLMFAAHVSWKAAVAAFVLVELLLLVTIRDNLTLNVWMLLFPTDAIEQWQLNS